MRKQLAVVSAMKLMSQSMKLADLALLVVQAHYAPGFVVHSPMWLNANLAETLADFSLRANIEYATAKLANLSRVSEPVAGVPYLSPYLPQPRSLCVHEGAIRVDNVGFSGSKLNQRQDLIAMSLFAAEALIGPMKLTRVTIANAKLTARQEKSGIVEAVSLPELQGKGVTWHYEASAYPDTARFMEQIFGGDLRPEAGGMAYNHFSAEVMDFGSLDVGFHIAPAR